MSREFTIGRKNAGYADILLEGSTISGIHANIAIDDSRGFKIWDTDSRNGTWVISRGQKRKIGSSPVFVSHSDVLKFGEEHYNADIIISNVPSPSREPKPNIVSNQAVKSCRHCGTVTAIGQACIECGR